MNYENTDDGGVAVEQPSAQMVEAIRRYNRLPESEKKNYDEVAAELEKVKGTEDEKGTILYLVRMLYPELSNCWNVDDANATLEELAIASDDSTADYQSWVDYVSQKLREARKKKGLTQEELADVAGIPQSHISRLETGKHSPSHITLKRLAQALDVNVGYFDPTFFKSDD